MGRIKKQIGSRVKWLRRLRGLSQEKLAQRISMSRETIRSLEAGESWPEEATLDAIASALEVEPEVLLGVTKSPLLRGWDSNPQPNDYSLDELAKAA